MKHRYIFFCTARARSIYISPSFICLPSVFFGTFFFNFEYVCPGRFITLFFLSNFMSLLVPSRSDSSSSTLFLLQFPPVSLSIYPLPNPPLSCSLSLSFSLSISLHLFSLPLFSYCRSNFLKIFPYLSMSL